MEDHRDVLVLSATRTAIGRYGGGLAAVPPCDLAAPVVREAVSRAGVEPAHVGHAVFGNGIHTQVRDMYLGRGAAVNRGLRGALPARSRACYRGVRPGTAAADYGVPRADRAGLAGESHRRAAAAADAGYFIEQITPVEVPGKKGTVTVDTDEHIRPGVTADDLARLRPAFAKDGTVTAGNASGVNDAAAAVGLADGEFAERHGHSPLGRLVAYAHAGVEPRIMGMGPVPAVRKALDRAGMKIDDIDLFEVNEAFAAQALAVVRELRRAPA